MFPNSFKIEKTFFKGKTMLFLLDKLEKCNININQGGQ